MNEVRAGAGGPAQAAQDRATGIRLALHSGRHGQWVQLERTRNLINLNGPVVEAAEPATGSANIQVEGTGSLVVPSKSETAATIGATEIELVQRFL